MPKPIRVADRSHYEARAQIAKAMANASRLMILDALEQGEHCVSDLTELVGLDQSTVSKHLSVLKGAGLVLARREGTTVFYALRAACLGGFWGCLETVLEANLEAQRGVTRRRR